MKESEAWRMQAASDFNTAEYIFSGGNGSMRCQVVAKYQQSVEKYIKGAFALVQEYENISRPKEHGHALEKYFKLLRIKAETSHLDGLAHSLKFILERRFISEASVLCSLAPSYPEKGDPFPKNTEYPFNTKQGDWIAPCALSVFSQADMERFQRVAVYFDLHVQRFFTAASVSFKRK